MGKSAAITTHDLSIGYLQKGKPKYVVHENINLELYLGEVTCLLGLNGAGKSTLLRTLCGFQPALKGSVMIAGQPLQSYTPSQFALMVGVVLTEKTNAGGITVFELAALGRHPHTGFFGQLGTKDRAIVWNALEAAGIRSKAEAYVSELSDGERQKAMIAKTLAQECPIILLDEPTAFLDVTSRIETMMLLHRLAVEQHKAILLSTHDLDLAIQMGDKLWLEEKSRPIACGTPEDLILDGTFRTFFERDNIIFDPTNGKLYAAKPTRPIALTGDTLTVYWAGNALIRNGYLPVSDSPAPIRITCLSPTDIHISGPSDRTATVGNIDGMIQCIAEMAI